MICHVKQSFEVKNGAGEKFVARNGDIVVPPDWVAHNSYFKALCDAGKVTVHTVITFIKHHIPVLFCRTCNAYAVYAACGYAG
jgi:hypothetical protein